MWEVQICLSLLGISTISPGNVDPSICSVPAYGFLCERQDCGYFLVSQNRLRHCNLRHEKLLNRRADLRSRPRRCSCLCSSQIAKYITHAWGHATLVCRVIVVCRVVNQLLFSLNSSDLQLIFNLVVTSSTMPYLPRVGRALNRVPDNSACNVDAQA